MMTEEEFSDYFRRMYPRLVAFASRCGNHRDADDLAACALETVWIKDMANPVDEGERAGLDALAFAVLRGLMLNHRRSDRRRSALLRRAARLDRSESGTPHDPDPPTWPDWFRALPPADREILLLLADGFTTQEIAQILRCTRAAASKRLSRARQRVRDAAGAEADRRG